MTQTGSPYDNALAESVNGQLKGEYNLDATFTDLAAARQAVDRAIDQYNNHRPHGSIDYRCPAEYHASFLDRALPGATTCPVDQGRVNAEPDEAQLVNAEPDTSPTMSI